MTTQEQLKLFAEFEGAEWWPYMVQKDSKGYFLVGHHNADTILLAIQGAAVKWLAEQKIVIHPDIDPSMQYGRTWRVVSNLRRDLSIKHPTYTEAIIAALKEVKTDA